MMGLMGGGVGRSGAGGGRGGAAEAVDDEMARTAPRCPQ